MNLTIGQFQDLNRILESPLDELEKSILMVQTMMDMSRTQVEEMKTSKFNKLLVEIKQRIDKGMKAAEGGSPSKFVSANGTLYQLHYDVMRIDAGRYVEVSTFATDPIGNLHKILASMAVPMKWSWKGIRAQAYDPTRHEKVAEDMKKVDFTVGYHAMVFFYAVWNGLIRTLNTSGSPAEQEQVERLLRLSESISGGYTMPKWYRNLSILN